MISVKIRAIHNGGIHFSIKKKKKKKGKKKEEKTSGTTLAYSPMTVTSSASSQFAHCHVKIRGRSIFQREITQAPANTTEIKLLIIPARFVDNRLSTWNPEFLFDLTLSDDPRSDAHGRMNRSFRRVKRFSCIFYLAW